jgi:hypothetical protein
MSSVADPDPEPDPDPHILGHPDPDPLVHAVHPLRAGDAHLRGEVQASLTFSPLLSCFFCVADLDPEPDPDPHILGLPDPDLLVHAVHPLGAVDAHLRGEGQASLTFSPLLSYHVVLFYPYEQCWGSGSRTGSGSAYFGPP